MSYSQINTIDVFISLSSKKINLKNITTVMFIKSLNLKVNI